MIRSELAATSGIRSDLVRTMEHSLARWVTYHLAAAAGLGVAGMFLFVLIVWPLLHRVTGRKR